MIVLHIEHSVTNFDNWKGSFDSYSELRQKLGVRRYQVLRSVQDPNHVTIDLEFASLSDAEALISAIQPIWQRVVGTLIHDPQWRISEVFETKALQR